MAEAFLGSFELGKELFLPAFRFSVEINYDHLKPRVITAAFTVQRIEKPLDSWILSTGHVRNRQFHFKVMQ